MWRLANFIYRAFRTVGTYRHPQDLVVPLITVGNKDEELDGKKNEDTLTQCKENIHQIIKNNQFSSQNVENLQKISYQQLIFQANVIDRPQTICCPKEIPPTPPSPQQEETLDTLLQADEACMSVLQSLSDLNKETMSMINNQLALEAIEVGDTKSGIEILQSSANDHPNAAALYNLGLCYEHGIGVQADRAKACDYYRQAAALGHLHAQLNLTLLSNRLDTNANNEKSIPRKSHRFNFSFIQGNQDEWNDYSFNLTKTLACLP